MAPPGSPFAARLTGSKQPRSSVFTPSPEPTRMNRGEFRTNRLVSEARDECPVSAQVSVSRGSQDPHEVIPPRSQAPAWERISGSSASVGPGLAESTALHFQVCPACNGSPPFGPLTPSATCCFQLVKRCIFLEELDPFRQLYWRA